MIAYIYHITNIQNGKKYIGKTINIKHRLECHFSDLALNKHHSIKLQRAYNKYGKENFKVTYQEVTVKDEEELNFLEIQEIQKYNSVTDGYNVTLGGEGHSLGIDFDTRVLIYHILKDYSGVNRQIAKYFNCDHTVIDQIAKNEIYEQIDFDLEKKNNLIKKLNLEEKNLKENYIKHNEQKLTEQSCFEILSVITNLSGYDKIICSVIGVHPSIAYRLKKKIIYKDYIENFYKLSKDEQKELCDQTVQKYQLYKIRGERQRAGVKNALTQEQINYILDNKDIKKRTEIGKELGISADRVGDVIKGKSYKDLVENYYTNCHG